jgi:hypothetical protein
MSSRTPSRSVNAHYLDKVMAVAEHMSVEVIVDILDVRGMKLVSKGTRVTRALQEKLILHKLMQPLEASLRATDSVDSNAISKIAARIVDTSAPVAGILRATDQAGGASALGILSQLEFGNAMSLMLTVSEKTGTQSLEHAVLVSLLSVCMAKKLRLSEQDQVVAGLAGLLHDIGELYIDPRYLARGKRLLPHEWSHIVVHPRIGEMLINELANFPAAVGRAVAEHHERFDGSGYPRQIAGSHISAPGQAVAVAEMIAGVLLKDHPLERAELALKIIPGEHAPDLLAAISGALRLSHAAATPAARWMSGESVSGLFMRLSAIVKHGESLMVGPAAKSPRTCLLLQNTLARVRKIQRAFASTGLDVYLQPVAFGASTDETLLFEKEVASRELQWRLRDIARDLALQTSSPDESVVLAGLIDLLDNEGLPAGQQALLPHQLLQARAPQPFRSANLRAA